MLGGLMLAATSLSGCQVFGGGKEASLSAQDFDMSEYFERRLATGRAELKAGRPTQAVVAFRQASYDPRYAGEAYNGMAIAYAQIGRDDLAASFFARAVAAAPEDERFARNLARLEGRGLMPTLPDAAPVEMAVNDPALPTASLADAVAPVAAVPTAAAPAASVVQPAARTARAEPRKRELTGAVRVERAPATQLARASTGQVRIGAEASGAVHLAEKGHPNVGITVEGRNSSLRVAQLARRGAQARKAYPIRIVLNSPAARAQRD
ncbi:tetratricopeptide repeat protein [Croceicoccus sp. BE223]|uniref:tetratricopeptide repeat protein n=1 Tax=Croceicoccus sp. BE223 TaxID=2817716 RepID=UPI00285CC80D|nr:tetratricopeptide repeat protein [Croceicoccus sp. BE223]MDR7102641.1 tetratricopeptide (TPR) repeat protein [Croceicoccus sp. BE223]